MSKHAIFAAAVILLIGMAASQAINGVPSEPMALGQVSPSELMQNSHNLPVETVDSFV